MGRKIETLTPLALHVLVALADEPRHGYAVIKDIEQRTGGRLSVRSGTLYVTLQRLLDGDLIEETADPDAESGDARRRCYRLTERGRRIAEDEIASLGQLLDAARRRLGLAGGRG